MLTAFRVSAIPLVLIVFATVVPNAAAQGSDVGVGVKIGINVATITGPTATKTSQVTGGIGGLFAGGTFTDIVGYQVEALVSQKGATAVDGRDQAKLRITYLDIPLLIRVGTVGAQSSAGVNAFFGPVLSLKMSTSATYNGQTDTSFKDSNVKGNDLGFAIGAAGTFGKFSVDARYTIGMASIDATTNPNDLKNRTFSLMAGYRFK